jgi:hypothetical protein
MKNCLPKSGQAVLLVVKYCRKTGKTIAFPK